jgi:two-component system, LytTR family, response regulator LytT
MQPLRILIIEDEKLTADDLRNTIKSIDANVVFMDTITNVEEGLDYFKTNPKIDLIFSDIQLTDGQSFEIFEKTKPLAPIIFCTAYNEYALKAFDTNGIDYILKPFSKSSVEKAISKFKNITKVNEVKYDFSEVISALRNQEIANKSTSIIVHQGDKILPINIDTIALFYIEDGNVKALTFDQKQLITNYKLEDLEKKFTPQFYRVNRQFFVNRQAVKDATQYFHRKLILNLTISYKEQIIVSKERVTSFLNWLQEQ